MDKLRKEYHFYVAAENKSNAIDLVEKEVNKVMGQTYVITKVCKLPNKEQVIDFYQD